jgi:hypothetical protein
VLSYKIKRSKIYYTKQNIDGQKNREIFEYTHFFFFGLTGFGAGAGFPGVTDTFITSSKLPLIGSLLSYFIARFFFAIAVRL